MATLNPKWLTALFLIALSIAVLTLGYFGYHFIKFENNERDAYLQGRKEILTELRGYFDDHPIIYKDLGRDTVQNIYLKYLGKFINRVRPYD